MKRKILSIILCVILVFSMCSAFASATTESDLKFAVASDLHYNVPKEELEDNIDDEIYSYANRRAALEDESGFIIDEFLNQCAEDDSEYVLISGDIVDNGRREVQQHYDVVEKFAAFEAKTGKDIFVIDGNHDLGNDSDTDIEKFKEIYADFGYDKALVNSDDDCSYTADLGSKYRLIALDSCDPSVSTEDGMSTAKLSWVKKQCKQAQDDGRYVILMMHHNLLDHMPLQRIISHNFIVRNHYATAEMFADWGVKIVLTGHEHCSDVAGYTSALGNTIYDFATTSLTMYPLEYRTFSLTDDEITYASKTIDKIDTQALRNTVKGYTDKQIDLMNDGLNSYSKGFLKAGVRYRLELSLSMEKMGISSDAIYYNLVKRAVDKLTGLLEMPLYGENSVESVASSYGITLPKTSYANGWDLATEFVAAHYAGEESFTLNSPEIKALLLTVSVLLREELSALSPVALNNMADAILASTGLNNSLDSINELAKTTFCGSVTAPEYFVIALISPFIYEFAYDSDGINDNNGTLPGYGTVSFCTNTNNIAVNVTNIFSKLIKYCLFFISYVLKAIPSI